jgi:tRNA-dihydrouridine synthase B
MQLGSILLKSRAILSPLESVSDVGFRSLCSELGAGLCWTEMIRAQALSRDNNSALDLIDTHDTAQTVPTGIQLLAKTPEALLTALQRLDSYVADGTRPHFNNAIAIDLNFGCPSPTILREGAGPALLKRRKRLSELFTVLVDWKHSTKLPIGAVGCKIRLGLNSTEVKNKVYLDAADIALASGLDYITVHARHAGQKSSVPSNWSAIKEIADRVGRGSNGTDKRMAVIGNGDVYTADDAYNMMSETGCDGVMIARGAIRNPWIFRDILRREASIIDNISNSDSTSDSSSGASTYSLPPLAPSVQEVNAAAAVYHACAQERDTKSKYSDFHIINFKRLLSIAKTGKEDVPFHVPKNQHIS